MAKNIIIGVGNILFCDDGIGVLAVEHLQKNYTFSPDIELLDGGTLGFNLAEYFLEYDNVFILDTISLDAKVGEIFKIPAQELLGGGEYKNTAHEVEVLSMLEACELYDTKADVTIFAIVPHDIETIKIGLSDVLEDKFEYFIQSVIDGVCELGIEVLKKT